MDGVCTKFGPEGPPCTAPADGTATCSGGQCDFKCNTGFNKCDNGCFECCADPPTNGGANRSLCPDVALPVEVSCQNHHCIYECFGTSVACFDSGVKIPHCVGPLVCVIAENQAQIDSLANQPPTLCDLSKGGGTSGTLKWAGLQASDLMGCRDFFTQEGASYCTIHGSGATYEVREFSFNFTGMYQSNAGETKTCP